MSGSSQKFIARNRAPRVQIEYDVELYGAEKKVQLPFVMGVMSDLSGKSVEPLPTVDDRKFLEIDVDNFDDRMKSMKPRAAFSVPNTLTEDGNLSVDLTFEKMEDFSPAAIARKVEPLRKLLEARTQLANLSTYMDGKAGAEDLIANLMSDPTSFRALAGIAGDQPGASSHSSALQALRKIAPAAEATDETTDTALAALRAAVPAAEDAPDTAASALDALRAAAPDGEQADQSETTEAALDALRDQTSEIAGDADDNQTGSALDALREQADGVVEPTEDAGEAALDALREAAPTSAPDQPDDTASALNGLRDLAVDSPTESGDDAAGAVLDSLRSAAVDDVPEADQGSSVLEELRHVAESAPDPVEDETSDALHALRSADVADDLPSDDESSALDTLRAASADGSEEPEDDTDAALQALLEGTESAPAQEDGTNDILDSLRDLAEDPIAEDESGALDALRASSSDVSEEPEEDDTDAALQALLDGTESPTAQEDGAEDILDSLRDLADDSSPEEDSTGDALDALRDAAVDLPDADESDDLDLEAFLAEDGAAEASEPGAEEPDLGAMLSDASVGPDADDLDALLADAPEAEETPDDDLAALLADNASSDVSDDLEALLADDGPHRDVGDALAIDDATDEAPVETQPAIDDLDALLAEDDAPDDLDALLSGDAEEEGREETDLPDDGDDLDLDALLANGSAEDGSSEEELSGDADLDALLADDEPVVAEADDFDLDALLADETEDGAGDQDETDLDALLDDDAATAGTDDEIDLDALLADEPDDTLTADADLDALLADDGAEPEERSPAPAASPEPEDLPFGTMSAKRPDEQEQNSGKFRIAILGDFSGRASRGELEVGAALGQRKAMKFDIDNIDDVIARFATTLVLPIGNDGVGIEVKLRNLDDLHPDELYDNVEVFEELSALRQRVQMGGGAAAISEMQGWAEEFGGLKLSARKRAKGTAVPADRKLSDFQKLIGDMQGQLVQPSETDDLIQRIVGPYVQAAPDPEQESMLAAVDEALSGAMRAVLHHPDFQAVESVWRSLDLLARRIETGAGMEIVLYDVSAEEWAADLSAQEDLAESGLFQMLAEEPRLDEAQGPLSAVFGLYTLEETPPHAELLARMSKISAYMDAPFVTAISPQFLETAKEDRHPLVAKTWDSMRKLPEAPYVGVVSPRFLLRLPYGKKTEPIYPFEFEEFTLRSGLKGMLWANPVILSAILMAATVTQMGKKMRLGEVMSLGDMPFYYMTDQYGDQVALPCTERLLNTRTAAEVVARGFMPVLSIKGRNEVRQGSFQALGAGSLAGSWGSAPGGATAGGATAEVELASGLGGDAVPETTDPAAEDEDLDALLGGLDDGDAEDDTGDDDLDALLAGFDDDAPSDDGEDDEMDAELAALLEGL